MATEEENIYSKITLYYDISEKIKEEILKLDDIDDSTKFTILMPIVDQIKNTADTLMEKYVVFLKDRDNDEIKNNIVDILDKFLEYIYVYKNKLYDIYKDK